MFFRIKKSGTHGYVQVVENKRVDGEVRQSVTTFCENPNSALTGSMTYTQKADFTV